MKIRFLLACFLACLLLLGYAAVVLACDDCPDCPPCYEPTGQPPNCGCIYVGCDPPCDPNECESCNENCECEVCDGDPNQICCDANCCDTDECEECVDNNCVTIDINSVTVDVEAVSVGCGNVTFTVITDPCGYGDDVEWSAPGADPCTGTGSEFTTSWDTTGTHTATASLCDSNDSNDVIVYKVDGVYPDEDTKVIISTKHDSNYPSSYQDEDGKIKVEAQITPVVEGLAVYFRTKSPDPDDGSPYDSPVNGDNIDVNSLPQTSASTDSNGVAETVLTITKQYAGDNYIVEASGCSTFAEYEESGRLFAWKRFYIEEDKMYKTGSDLAADFTADGDSSPDTITVEDGSLFATDDVIDIFDANNSETRTILDIDGDDIEVADLTHSYNAGYGTGDKGAAVGRPSDGFYQADIGGRTPNAFGSDPNGSDGGCFTEFEILEVDGNTVNKVPYRLAMGDNYFASESYREVWFKNKDEQDYFWVCGACQLKSNPSLDYGAAYHAYNTSYVFVKNIEILPASDWPIMIADTTAHEIGHQFVFDVGEVDGYHELVWCHEGISTDRCFMDNDCDEIDAWSEFCYDGDNHLMEVRAFLDQKYK